jgi:LPXTG-motif cell wall-anchored protein
MLERVRAALPACALAAAAVVISLPSTASSASAATAPRAAAAYVSVASVLTVVDQDGESHLVDFTRPGPSGLWYQISMGDVVMSPDGHSVYVSYVDPKAQSAGANILRYDVASGAVSDVLPDRLTASGSAPRLALTPDGRTGFLSSGNDVYRIELGTGSVSDHWSLGSAVNTLALSPDGETAYVTSGNRLLKLDSGSGTVTDALPLGRPAGAIKVTADGRTAYVIGNTDDTPGVVLFKVDLSTFTVTDQVTVAGVAQAGHITAHGLALSPDQSQLYVVGLHYGLGVYIATAVQTADLVASPGFAIGSGLEGSTVHDDVAFSADGSAVYTYRLTRGAGTMVKIDVASQTASVIPSDFNGGGFTAVTTPADQAPVARIRATAHCAGTATAFDASPSTVPQGKIVRYAWAFGDGTTKVTARPTTTHVYAAAGSYTATVTETDSAGTSTTVVFDGQSVLLNGGPQARTRRTVSVKACPVPGGSGPTGSPGSQASSVVPADGADGADDGTLPLTGATTMPALLAAGALMGAGGALLRIGRRRVRG